MSITRFASFILIFLVVQAFAPADSLAGKYSKPKSTKQESGQPKEGRPSRGVLSNLEEVAKDLSELKNLRSAGERNFMLGYADYQRGRWRDADAFFAAAQGEMQRVGDYILFYRAAIANNIGRYGDAAKFLGSLSASYPDSVWAREAEFEMGRSLIGLGRYQDARERLARYKASAKDHRVFDVDILIAQSLVRGGDASAVGYVRNLAIHAGSSEELAELRPLFDEVKKSFGADIAAWLSEPEQQLSLARSYFERSCWDDAARTLEGIGSAGGLDARWLLAKCYKWLGRYDEAIALMNGILDSPGGKSYEASVQGLFANVYAKKNDYASAIDVRRRMMGRAPRASVLFKIAFLLMDEGKYDEAIGEWKNVLSARPRGEQRAQARWYLGWCHYMQGRYDEALEIFGELIRAGAKAERIDDRVMYWTGRILLKQQRGAEARGIFEDVILRHPGGYYAELSKRQLAGQSRSPANFMDADAGRSGKSNWHPGGDGESSGQVHMARAAFFDRLTLNEEAARELGAMNLIGNGEIFDEIMWYASRNYAHELSYRIANSFYRYLLKDDPDGDPFCHFVWEQNYPQAYYPMMMRAAAENGVDPVLAWSIMRNESTFRPHVVSPAGAVGLMQLMPTTARRVTAERGGSSFNRRSLYQPAANIALGVAYLGILGRMFPGNSVAVIASYNAGEEAAARWLKNGRMNDIEEWIEEIPYSETNLYVKKVLSSYWNYKRLYMHSGSHSGSRLKN